MGRQRLVAAASGRKSTYLTSDAYLVEDIPAEYAYNLFSLHVKDDSLTKVCRALCLWVQTGGTLRREMCHGKHGAFGSTPEAC